MYQKVVLLHRSLVKFLSKAKHKSLVEWIIGLNWHSRSDARLKYVDSLSTSRTTGGLFPRTTPLVELVVGSERLSELIPQTVQWEREQPILHRYIMVEVSGSRTSAVIV